MIIYNFDDEVKYPLSNRDGIYGGNGGNKDGILIDGEYWFIKYPKTTRGMSKKAQELGYTTAPLSEYIGSHIYQILGFDVHDTLLGIKRGKTVVACKDFCVIRGGLSEIRTIKNAYNSERSEELAAQNESKSGDRVNLPELMLHLEENRQLRNVPGLKEHFWDMVIVDILIDNNDRNNGNWGLVFNGEVYKIAPVYDNGNAFSNKTSDEKIRQHLSDSNNLEKVILGSAMTAYDFDGHMLNSQNLLQMDYSELKEAILRNIPNIGKYLEKMLEMVDEIPETYAGNLICSSERKEFYKAGLILRYEKILLPAYERLVDKRQEQRIGFEDAKLEERAAQRIELGKRILHSDEEDFECP